MTTTGCIGGRGPGRQGKVLGDGCLHYLGVSWGSRRFTQARAAHTASCSRRNDWWVNSTGTQFKPRGSVTHSWPGRKLATGRTMNTRLACTATPYTHVRVQFLLACLLQCTLPHQWLSNYALLLEHSLSTSHTQIPSLQCVHSFTPVCTMQPTLVHTRQS